MPRLKPAVPGFFLVLIFLTLAFSLTGCSPLKPDTDPSLDAKALAAARVVQHQNTDITTTKGAGNLTLEMGQTRERFKMAWAAQAPDRLRLTLLSLGHPVETIAASGESVSIISHTGRHAPHRTASANPGLNPYIGIPVKLSDMVSLLLGRYPILPFDRAWYVPDTRNRIRTSRNFSARIQEIEFDLAGRLSDIRLLDRDGLPVYHIRYNAYQTSENRVLPKDITLTAASGQTHTIRLVHIHPNETIKPAVFRLTASGS